MACLAAHAQAIRSATDALPSDLAADDAGSRWRGRLVAVTGDGGAGTSTVAMALAQGLARLPGNTGSVVLADLAGCGDLAMYHDVRDVMPGLQELVEAHRSTTPSRAVVRRLLFDIDERGYSLLLGLRRSRDWTALRPRALDAAVESLRASFRAVVADVRPEFDGEAETGSVDLEERNGPSRVAVVGADVVVVCGDASLKGIHALIRTERDVLGVGVETVGTDAGQAGGFDPMFPSHNIMHGSGRFGLASLTNLDQLPPTGAVVIAAPLKIVNGSGSPLRVLALVPKS